MRLSAFILLFPFAIFITETINVIPAMQDACAIVAKPACTKTGDPGKGNDNDQTGCCRKTSSENECSSKKSSDKETPDKKCTDTPDCTTCPVCYNFLFQSRYEWPEQTFSIKKSYGLINTNYLSSYTTNVWKPPNGFF